MPSDSEVDLLQRVSKLEATQEAQQSILVDLQKKVDQLWWKMGVIIGAIAVVGGNASEIVKSLAG